MHVTKVVVSRVHFKNMKKEFIKKMFLITLIIAAVCICAIGTLVLSRATVDDMNKWLLSVWICAELFIAFFVFAIISPAINRCNHIKQIIDAYNAPPPKGKHMR